MTIPRISHPTDRPNFTRLDMGEITIYFSYQTPIAFIKDHGLTIRENNWGPTTGKHLNYVNSTSERVPTVQFDSLLQAALS